MSVLREGVVRVDQDQKSCNIRLGVIWSSKGFGIIFSQKQYHIEIGSGHLMANGVRESNHTPKSHPHAKNPACHPGTSHFIQGSEGSPRHRYTCTSETNYI